MITTTHTLEPGTHSPFYITATRYQDDNPRTSGYTLILLHAAGLHKETYEPLAEALLEFSRGAEKSVTVREVWSVGELSVSMTSCI